MVQFLKAFTPVVVSIVGVMILKRRESTAVWISLSALCCGTALTAIGETNLSLVGLLLAVTSALSEAVRLILTEFLVKDLKFSLWETQYYLSPLGGATLLMAGILLEGQAFISRDGFAVIVNHPLQVPVQNAIAQPISSLLFIS